MTGFTGFAGSPFAANRLMVASLVLALVAIALRHAPGLGASAAGAAADACFLASIATLSAALLQGGVGGLLGRTVAGPQQQEVPQDSPQGGHATAWDVQLEAAHPVHDPSMAGAPQHCAYQPCFLAAACRLPHSEPGRVQSFV